MADDPEHSDHPLRDVTDRVKSASEDGSVTVEKIAEVTGRRSILSMLLIPALIAATPLSGIPGVSAVCGLLIALLSAELIFGFTDLYLPGKLERQSIDGARLRSMLERISPLLDWLDRHTGNRLAFLFHRPLIWLPQLLCLASGLAMPFLEFIPFSSSIVAFGVCLLVISMLARDGLFFLLALIPYAGAAYVVARMVV